MMIAGLSGVWLACQLGVNPVSRGNAASLITPAAFPWSGRGTGPPLGDVGERRGPGAAGPAREPGGETPAPPGARASDQDRQLLVAAYGAGVQPVHVVVVDLPGREPLEDLFEGVPALHPRERGAEAEVRAVA